MEPLKREAINAISKLSDDTDMDEIMYRLYVIDRVRKGQAAVKNGQTTNIEDLEREINSW